ncbi:hypothetical protein QBC46DRAFT_402509 [Diplogelasinospora grovesii]|uniref:Rhodopsin domain-containing protein n=1 Tax=Diplogelasinospora grovesii TaxID=303347 RepID=A0AAN6S9L1_9PEZI|nr:hypothetical protein QBC46DRAFT_402509 [Diplogelasinospora grovesii]
MPSFNHPGVPYNTYLGLMWAAEGFALVFLSIRLYSRLHGQRRLFWDDAFVILATILTTVVAGLWQWQAAPMYQILNVAAGLEAPAADFFDKEFLWLKVQLSAEILFYTSLTAVKLAFLFFFKRLGNNVNRFNWYWWPVVLFVLAIYFVSMGNIQYRCLLPTAEDLLGYCISDDANNFTAITLKFNCAMDVFSDFLIILIPVSLLWNVRMRLAKKMAFVGLFSLSLVTMAVATARAADLDATKWDNGVHDPTYLWLWSAIEPCIAITVSCLSAFPQLFAASTRGNKPVYTPTDSYRRMITRIRSRTNMKQRSNPALYDLSNISQAEYIQAPDAVSTDSLRRPVLVPGSPKPVTVCYKAPPQERSGDEMSGYIKQELR